VRERRYVEVPADPWAPGLARSHVADTLVGVQSEAVATAALVVSELVSNAVRRASATGDPIGVLVLKDEHIVRIEVVDVGAGFDLARPRGSASAGLRIVEDLSLAWGVDAGPPHRVWCDLRV
jgi:anti-sigma regulatory factor (Ser/Thr protein kinase)